MNAYEIVTEMILRKLESGVIPWHKPWRSEQAAYNLVSGKPYSFLNQMLLPMPGAYLSFNQIKDLGGHIREGEHASRVVFFKLLDRKGAKEDDEEKSSDKIPLLRYYNVWNISQVEGIDPAKIPSAGLDESLEADDDCEDVLMGYLVRSGVKFQPKLGSKAAYCEATDTVVTPILSQFSSSESYYSTVFHELVHSTGAESRLARNLRAEFGSRDYSREELVAEIGSAMICSQLDIDTADVVEDQASYIAYWRERLGADPTLIVTASGRAEKAARLILGTAA